MNENNNLSKLKAELILELKAGISAELKADFTNAIDAYLVESFSMSSNIRASKKFLKHLKIIKEARIAKVDLDYDILEREQIRESRLSILRMLEEIPDQFLRFPNEYTLHINSELLHEQLNFGFSSPITHTLIANEFDDRKIVEPVFTNFSQILTKNEFLVLSDIKQLIDQKKLIVVKPVIINDKIDNPLAFEEKESMLFNFQHLDNPLSSSLTDFQRSLSISILMQTGILRISEAIPYGSIARGPVKESKNKQLYDFYYTSEIFNSMYSELKTDEELYCSTIKLTFTEIGFTFTSSIVRF